jgi:predicted DNA-binding transcriptional regulator YafY
MGRPPEFGRGPRRGDARGAGAPAAGRAPRAAARAARRPVRVRYFSLNSGLERTYELVPLRYVTVAPVVKALCVPVDATGHRTDRDRQFALDRLIDVEPLPDWPEPSQEARRLQRSPIELEVSDGLYHVMVARNLLGIDAEHAEQVDVDVWRVRGSFPTALAWDVMEQLCAWAGTAQVREPLWLVNAVCRRLRKGLAVMETSEVFELVKPDPDRAFTTHGEAVSWEPAPADGRAAPRRLTPRR